MSRGRIMSTQTLTVPVPDGLLARIRERAREANRTVEAEVLEVLSSALTPNNELPADLAEAVSALHLLDEPALRRAAESRLPAESSSELEALHLKQRREGLTEAEDESRRDLIRQYERAMLVRAAATALLHGRNKNGQAQGAWIAKFAGMFKDDPLFESWQRSIAEYRREVDADPDYR